MQYPFILKLSSIHNLSDARYAAGMWADFAGFCFDPSSPDYVEPAKAKEIAGWINGPLICGEFGQQPPEWISEFVQNLNLNCVEIPSDYPFETTFLNTGIKSIVRVNQKVETPVFNHADIFICNQNDIYEWLQIFEKPVLLEIQDFSINASTIEGIALKGEIEDKPGTRNHANWTDFLEKWVED